MDPAQEVDDDGARSGFFGQTFAEEPSSNQDTKTRSRIGFNEVENGFAVFGNLSNAQRTEDAVIDRIVQEEDLAGSTTKEAKGNNFASTMT